MNVLFYFTNNIYLLLIYVYRKTTVVGQKLKLVNDLFSLLCRSATELNSLFSIPILYMITTKILSISISIFIFISQFHHPVENLTLIAWYYMAYTLVDVIILAVIFYAADAPNRQVFPTTIHSIPITSIGPSILSS